ncbi:MAG: ATP-dependent helicase HrpB [Alphaproteobacteria bacterium]|nr:ATP-dependent helicase HrpB [Alphaproteobacteria bacterium]
MTSPLPIDAAIPDVLDAVGISGAVVVIAPPGSGKTTRIPGAILDAGLAGDGKVVVLQPRRVAARLAAARIAEERGVPLGGEVGYQVRFERRISAATRLELLTEGLLLRRLQDDPFLEGVNCVVLDEFHERSLHVDLALALLAEVRRDARPDLHLVVMSATLDPEPVSRFLGDCPIVQAEGRVFPVDVRYDPSDRPIPAACAAAVRRHLPEDGHTLVFLPGVAEIEATAEALGGLPDVDILPLHGRLSSDAQARALAPSRRRKVVLATNIAETSVTLDGARLVVDAGLARVPQFDLALGLERLETVRISTANADQRAGRAGRTGPGLCVRLWSEAEQRCLRPFEMPELHRTDLSGPALQLHAWGVDPREFNWFEPPSPAALAQAEGLLVALGALDAHRALTPLGRTLARFPLPPRHAAVVVAGQREGCLEAAATAAALATERDPFDDGDLLERVDRVRRARGPRGPLRRVRQVADQLTRVATSIFREGQNPGTTGERALTRALLAGFPERVGQRRAPHSPRLKLASGTGAVLDHPEQVEGAALVLAVSVSAGRGAERRVRLACPVDEADLTLEERRSLRFDPQGGSIQHTVETCYGALVLRERPCHDPPAPERVAALLAEAAAARPQDAFTRTPAFEAWRDRLTCLADWMPELGLPDLRDLGPFIPELCVGRRSFAELRALDLRAALEARLSWPQRQAVERLAPARFTLPTGRVVPLVYTPGAPPVLAARIQQLFGLTATPAVADGRVPVRVHLLAPNQRPVQVTQDLASFWASTYAEVRKDLRGRYPKHAWPEDPTTATPEDHPRRRG